MADTIPNIPLIKTEFIDVYAESGITVGDDIKIQFKGRGIMTLIEQAAQPTDTANDGSYVKSLCRADITNSPTGLWAKGEGVINVQAL